MGDKRHGVRMLVVTLAALGVASCFLPRLMERPEAPPDPGLGPAVSDSVAVSDSAAEAAPAAERTEPANPLERAQPAEPASAEISAIIDSIETSVQDSIDASARAERVAHRDSIMTQQRAAAARRDSIRRAERAAARQDSIDSAQRAAAQRDSLEVRRDSLARIEAARSEAETELERLRASGPAYIPYEEGARLVWDTDAEAALATTLLPVIRAEGLDADIGTTVWLLVRADGRVDATVIQTSSDNAAFDAAAERAARALIFAPALRDGRVAPVWVLREISLLMR